MAKQSTLDKLLIDEPTDWVKEMIGKKFGRLYIIKAVGYIKNKSHFYVECKCDCGVITIKKAQSIKAGEIISCDCFRKEMVTLSNSTHGESRYKKKNKIYNAWNSIKDRCFNPEKIAYKDYGGRGITMCDAMKNSYVYFKNHIGQPPNVNRISLDRIDNEGNYSCGKCDQCISNGWKDNLRWVDMLTQANNKRNNVHRTINGKKITAAQMARLVSRKYGSWFIHQFKNGVFDNIPI